MTSKPSRRPEPFRRGRGRQEINKDRLGQEEGIDRFRARLGLIGTCFTVEPKAVTFEAENIMITLTE